MNPEELNIGKIAYDIDRKSREVWGIMVTVGFFLVFPFAFSVYRFTASLVSEDQDYYRENDFMLNWPVIFGYKIRERSYSDKKTISISMDFTDAEFLGLLLGLFHLIASVTVLVSFGYDGLSIWHVLYYVMGYLTYYIIKLVHFIKEQARQYEKTLEAQESDKEEQQ